MIKKDALVYISYDCVRPEVDHMMSLNSGRTVVEWIIYLSDKNLAWLVVSTWNALPTELKNSRSLNTFRTGLEEINK